MSDSPDQQDWTVAGHGETEYSNKIYIPADVLENPEIIRDNQDSIVWHYANIAGYAVIANDRLDESYGPDKKYEYVDSTQVEPIGDGPTSYRVTVPKPFFEDNQSQTHVDDTVPEYAQFQYDESYYFIYHDEMTADRIKSCYLLHASEFSKVIPEGAKAAFTEEARERADISDDQVPDLTDTPRFS